MLSISYSALLHDYFAATDRKMEMTALEAIHSFHTALVEKPEKHGAHRSATGDNYMIALKSAETWDSSRPAPAPEYSLRQVEPVRFHKAPKRLNMSRKQSETLRQSKLSFSEDGSKLIRPFHGNPLGRMSSNTDKLAFASAEKTAKHVALVVAGTGTNLAAIANQPMAIQLDKLIAQDAQLLRDIDKHQSKGSSRAEKLLLQLASNRQRINDILDKLNDAIEKAYPDMPKIDRPAWLLGSLPYTAPIRAEFDKHMIESKPHVIQSKRQGSLPPKSRKARGRFKRWSEK